MKELDVNSLVVVETLPKIMEQLDVLGEYIDEGLKDIDKLDCTEENKQFVKKKRAEINNTLKILEDKRKEIKNKILEPYNVFNSKFEDVAKIKLLNASQTLANKINEIENAQKQEKTNMLIEFAERQFVANEIQDVVKFEDIGLNITLSASEKSLKEQVVAFCERVRNDLDTILLEELKDEIFAEYKKCLSYTQAKQIVTQRHKDLEIAKQQSEKLNNAKQEEIKIQSAVFEVINDADDDIKAPQVSEIETTNLSDKEEMLVVTFTIRETRAKLKLLKQFMIDNDIKYE
jgi:hypothetical protein